MSHWLFSDHLLRGRRHNCFRSHGIQPEQTKGPNDFRSLRDELKGTYGDPTSETDEIDRPVGLVPGGNVDITQHSDYV